MLWLVLLFVFWLALYGKLGTYSQLVTTAAPAAAGSSTGGTSSGSSILQTLQTALGGPSAGSPGALTGSLGTPNTTANSINNGPNLTGLGPFVYGTSFGDPLTGDTVTVSPPTDYSNIAPFTSGPTGFVTGATGSVVGF